MPVWLSLFIAGMATVGFFGGLYLVITLLVEGKRAKSKPRMGLAPGGEPGTLGFWATWNPKQFTVNVYRLRLTYARPESSLKEGVMTVTLENPQSEPFFQTIRFTPEFKEVIESTPNRKALVTIEMKTVDELLIFKTVWVGKLRQIMGGKAKAVPKGLATLEAKTADVPWVASLEYEELMARTKKVKDMEAAAKAKAAKAAAAKAAAEAPAATTPAPAAVTATPAKPAPAVAEEAPGEESPAAKAAAALKAVRTASRNTKQEVEE